MSRLLIRSPWQLALSLLLSASLTSCELGGARADSQEVDGLRLTIWVSDHLVRIEEPFDIRLTLTNIGSNPIILDYTPQGDAAAKIAVRAPSLSGDAWVVVEEWSEGCGSPIQLAPGDTCSITTTWAIPQGLGADAVIVAGVIWYRGELREVAVGVAEAPSPF